MDANFFPYDLDRLLDSIDDMGDLMTELADRLSSRSGTGPAAERSATARFERLAIVAQDCAATLDQIESMVRERPAEFLNDRRLKSRLMKTLKRNRTLSSRAAKLLKKTALERCARREPPDSKAPSGSLFALLVTAGFLSGPRGGGLDSQFRSRKEDSQTE